MKVMPNDKDMLKEYDFSNGIKGKYADSYAEGTNVVMIEPDIAAYFPDHKSVNESLRLLVSFIKSQKKRTNEQDAGH